MYLEILSDTVANYLQNSSKATDSILADGIHLTPRIYEMFHLELNDVIKLNTEVPIEYITADSIKIQGRTVKIVKGSTLDAKFEFFLTNKLAELNAIASSKPRQPGDPISTVLKM